jgi:hypothetical protein
MPRFVTSQSQPGLVTYENEDGSPGITVPEDWARMEGYEIADPMVPDAVLFDPTMSPRPLESPAPVPQMEPGMVGAPMEPLPQVGAPMAPMPAPIQEQAPAQVPQAAPTAPPAPPPIQQARVTPDQRRTYGYELEKEAVAEEHELRAEQADEEARGMAELATREARDANEMAFQSAKTHADAKDRVLQWKDDVAKFRAQKINPHREWESRSQGQQVATIASMVLGGFIEPYTGKNSAVAMFERAIERDLDAQRTDMQIQSEALGLDRASNADLLAIDASRDEQEYKFRAESRLAFKDKIAARMSTFNSGIAKAQGAKTIAGIEQSQAKDDAAQVDRNLQREELRLQNEGRRLDNQGKRLDNAGKLAPQEQGQGMEVDYEGNLVAPDPKLQVRHPLTGEFYGNMKREGSKEEIAEFNERSLVRIGLAEQLDVMMEKYQKAGMIVGDKWIPTGAMNAEQKALWHELSSYTSTVIKDTSGTAASDNERKFIANDVIGGVGLTSGNPIANWRRIKERMHKRQNEHGNSFGVKGTGKWIVLSDDPEQLSPRERAEKNDADLYEGGGVSAEVAQKKVDRYKAGPQPDGVKGYEKARTEQSEAEAHRQRTQMGAIKSITDDAERGLIPTYPEQLEGAGKERWADENGVYSEPAMVRMRKFVDVERKKPNPNIAAVNLAEGYINQWEAERVDAEKKKKAATESNRKSTEFYGRQKL